jgi:hypothetical protein
MDQVPVHCVAFFRRVLAHRRYDDPVFEDQITDGQGLE